MLNAESAAVIEIVNADFGEDVEYDEMLSGEAEERYSERLEDYAEAHAEAEAGLQDLSAG
ncbi:MAG TPA: hypothetical protein VG816_09580 [Solirubrobacterales bacterium]|nr:hypothetical protein [Solirubrobacterales bacterium]